ncbi:MAG: hypothetical protein ACXWT0_03895 [Methylobacter sp.]
MSNINKIEPQLFHEYLEGKINASDIKQSEMAEELGFAKPNIITMFKQGKTRVPLEKVPGFAKVLKLDPKMLLRMAMLEYCPELYRAVDETFGSVVTRNEKMILDEIRRLSQNTDPAITSIADKKATEVFVKQLMTKTGRTQ